MKIENTFSVITGAGSGIGRALAVALAGPCQGVAICDIDAEKMRETARLVEAKGCQVFTQVVNVADREAVEAFAIAVMAAFGQVDIVINNAGVAIGRASVAETPYADFEWIVGINMWGMIYGTKAFLPHLQQRPAATVVNISSLFGIIGIADQAAYCTTKFAIRGFNESMRMEARDHYPGLQVISVHPGGIATNIAQAARKVTDAEQELYDLEIKDFEKILRMPPEKAAAKIIRGIRKNRGRVLIGYDAKLLDLLARLFPRWYVGILGWRILRQKRKVQAKFEQGK
ncbi:MAG TPA: SDR family NAD(P)-dependent oxidoreductase [Bacteroidetes bacterium]|nr:SDR family NAD(P)-dependent oxidoreductase [Bacteroidota bacterium]